jgi:hypothetical protein
MRWETYQEKQNEYLDKEREFNELKTTFEELLKILKSQQTVFKPFIDAKTTDSLNNDMKKSFEEYKKNTQLYHKLNLQLNKLYREKMRLKQEVDRTKDEYYDRYGTGKSLFHPPQFPNEIDAEVFSMLEHLHEIKIKKKIGQQLTHEEELVLSDIPTFCKGIITKLKEKNPVYSKLIDSVYEQYSHIFGFLLRNNPAIFKEYGSVEYPFPNIEEWITQLIVQLLRFVNIVNQFKTDNQQLLTTNLEFLRTLNFEEEITDGFFDETIFIEYAYKFLMHYFTIRGYSTIRINDKNYSLYIFLLESLCEYLYNITSMEETNKKRVINMTKKHLQLFDTYLLSYETPVSVFNFFSGTNDIISPSFAELIQSQNLSRVIEATPSGGKKRRQKTKRNRKYKRK